MTTYWRECSVVFQRQIRMNLRNPAWVLIGIMQPVLYLLLFGPLLEPLVSSVRDFLKDLPATVEQLRESDELSWLGDSGAAENVQSGAEEVAASVPETISALLGVAGDFFTIFVAAFTILFTCLVLLSDIGNMKQALASVLAPGEEERWLAVWERVTESVSRWAIGVIVIAVIAGTTQIDSASGDIWLGVAPGTTAWLEVQSLSGDVTSELQSAGAPDEDAPTVSIQARTLSGDVAIRRAVVR